MKSALLSAFWASKMFAPIEVPERKSCFAITYFLSCSRTSVNFIIAREKETDFSTITFFLSSRII